MASCSQVDRPLFPSSSSTLALERSVEVEENMRSENPEFRLLSVGEVGNSRIEKPDENTFTLIYVLDGNGVIEMDTVAYPFKSGSVLCISGSSTSRAYTVISEFCRRIHVIGTGTSVSSVLNRYNVGPEPTIDAAQNPYVKAGFVELLRLARDGGPHRCRALVLQLELLLIALSRSLEVTPPSQQRAYSTYIRCREYLETNYVRVCAISDIAAACRVDVSYLSRLFLRFAQTTPRQLLEQLRMRHAAILLKEHLLVREAADLLQMDPFHFSRVFKRVHGVPPSEFAAR